MIVKTAHIPTQEPQFRHSERSPRSAVRFCIARLSGDESLFHFFSSLRRSLRSLCSYLCDLCESVPLLFARHSPPRPDPIGVATRHCSVVIPSAAKDLFSPNHPINRPNSRLLLHLLYFLTVLYLLPPPSRAQNLDKPLVNVDDDVTAFAYAPDGRIVFSVRRMYKTKKYDLQRDDIFLLDTNGKRRRLFTGEKFTNGDKPFTYLVESFSWSPNGHILAVQLYTITANPEGGPADEARALLLLDDSGHELRPGGKEPLVMNAENPLWLRDNTTLVYLTEEVAPRALFSMKYLNVTTGPAAKALEGRTFLAAKRIPGSNSAIAVERNRNLDGPARLQRLDLLSQETAEVATLDSYAGGLSLSPSGAKVAYYLDKEVLEVRDLAAPNKVARLRIGLGVLQWSADESRIYLKRTLEKKSADLAEFPIPPLAPYSARQPIAEPTPRMLLHGLTVREFGLSQDGRFLAIVLPGKRNLQVFPF